MNHPIARATIAALAACLLSCAADGAEQPIIVVRHDGNDSCWPSFSQATIIGPESMTVTGFCGGLYAREMDLDGGLRSEARRLALTNGASRNFGVSQAIRLIDGRTLVSAVGDQWAAKERSCQFFVVEAGEFVPITAPFATLYGCGDLRPAADGGFVHLQVIEGVAVARGHASDGSIRWSRTFEGEGNAVLDVAEDVAWLAWIDDEETGDELVMQRVSLQGELIGESRHDIADGRRLSRLVVDGVPFLTYHGSARNDDDARVVTVVDGAMVDRQVSFSDLPVYAIDVVVVGDHVVVSTAQGDDTAPMRGRFTSFDASLEEQWRATLDGDGQFDKFHVDAAGRVAVLVGREIRRLDENGSPVPPIDLSSAMQVTASVHRVADEWVAVGADDLFAPSGDIVVARFADSGEMSWRITEGSQPLGGRLAGAHLVGQDAWILGVAVDVPKPGLIGRYENGVLATAREVPYFLHYVQPMASGQSLISEIEFLDTSSDAHLTMYSAELEPRWVDDVPGFPSRSVGLDDGAAATVLNAAFGDEESGFRAGLVRHDATGNRTFLADVDAILPGDIDHMVGDASDLRVAGTHRGPSPAAVFTARVDADGVATVTSSPYVVDGHAFDIAALKPDGATFRVGIREDGHRVAYFTAAGVRLWESSVPGGGGDVHVMPTDDGGAWWFARDPTTPTALIVSRLSADGSVSTTLPPGQPVEHSLQVILNLDDGGVVLGGSHCNGDICEIGVTAFDETGRVAWRWRKGGDDGPYQLTNVIIDRGRTFVAASVPLPVEGRRAVVYEIDSVLFGDGFE